MNSEEYWKLVETNKQRLLADFSKKSRTDDPIVKFMDEHTAYVTSVYNPQKDIVAGAVCQVTWRDAAKCETDMTHRLSTAAEIQKYLDAAEVRAQEYVRMEHRRQKKTTVVNMTADQLGLTFPKPAPVHSPAGKTPASN